ncbi:ABC transporter permease [Mycoplasmopsis verecunda]|uniref:Simple sugar transport system permease protein n=1 Tax=Mycoplasmopsis verecunda TaxID=171291 RepID=A0A1T4L326_9BACT|nr:ABC transporter permease [Mycoplasmopsis verecunda]WPB54450.1 ABC transporter permease [Mycoplasmopsis verecunda]SJZ49125.1 simple sugar transport system permease protein [Mycoplasmopsis verecunda]
MIVSQLEPIITFAIFYFSILVLGSISGIFSERAGIVNIAIAGFMVFGATMYMLFSYILTVIILGGHGGSIWFQIPLTIIAVLCSGVFSLLFGYATIKLKSDQTISGFAINILSTGIATLLVFVLVTLQNSSTFQFYNRTELALSGSLLKYQNILSFRTVMTVTIIISSWFVIRKTRWGLRFRSIGENPQAADVAGINVNKVKWQAVITAGMIAGIAGAFFAQAQPAVFSNTYDTNGFGFLALAIMITARWRVTLSVIISLFFSILLSISFNGTGLTSDQALLGYLRSLPYIVTLIIMMLTAKNSAGPAAAGVPYDKSKR